jgi:hypothetical protein
VKGISNIISVGIREVMVRICGCSYGSLLAMSIKYLHYINTSGDEGKAIFTLSKMPTLHEVEC